MKHTSLSLFVLSMVLLSLSSCNKADYACADLPTQESRQNASIQFATFGPQTGHPFAMKNVLAALYNLRTKASMVFPEDDIAPTHLYVRFTPKTGFILCIQEERL